MTVEDELVSIADRLKAIAESLSPPTETTEDKELTLEEVRAFLVKKSRVSKENQEAIREILKTHGVSTLSELNPLDYEAVMEEVKTLSDG